MSSRLLTPCVAAQASCNLRAAVAYSEIYEAPRRWGLAGIIPDRGLEASSGTLSWFSPSGPSSDMGTQEPLEGGMSQLEKINLHMWPVGLYGVLD